MLEQKYVFGTSEGGIWWQMKFKAEQYASSDEEVTESMYMTGKNEFMYSLPS